MRQVQDDSGSAGSHWPFGGVRVAVKSRRKSKCWQDGTPTAGRWKNRSVVAEWVGWRGHSLVYTMMWADMHRLASYVGNCNSWLMGSFSCLAG